MPVNLSGPLNSAFKKAKKEFEEAIKRETALKMSSTEVQQANSSWAGSQGGAKISGA